MKLIYLLEQRSEKAGFVFTSRKPGPYIALAKCGVSHASCFYVSLSFYHCAKSLVTVR